MSDQKRRHLIPLLDFICFVCKQSNDEQLRFPRRINGSLNERFHYSSIAANSKINESSLSSKVHISLGHIVTKESKGDLPHGNVNKEKRSRIVAADDEECSKMKRNDVNCNCQMSAESQKLHDIVCSSKSETIEVLEPIIKQARLFIDTQHKKAKEIRKLYVGKECLYFESENSPQLKGCITDIDTHERKAQIIPYEIGKKDVK